MNKLALSDDILLKIDKPARYIGNEVNSVIKDPEKVDIRFAFCFPEVYEIGMSHLGLQILYDMFNRRDDVWCERVFSPWVDLDKIMREEHIPLFTLESQDPVKKFDFVGFTLQFEMCYTNILQVLDLSGIPLHTEERTLDDPFVIGGGPCAYNPEPLADFFDMFYIGEGEVVYDELFDAYKEWKHSGKDRTSFLEMAAEIEGIYVPSFYRTDYNPDGTIAAFTPVNAHAKERIRRQVAADMSTTTYPLKPIVPFIKVTQDRAVLEIQRGCIRGCRFCQAGMVYRPTRPRDINMLKETAKAMLRNTGHEEITLSSLSSSDYNELEEIVNFLIDEFHGQGVNISLPSLRIDAFSLDVMSKVQDIRKSSLTFAPEAGSERLRDVINKNVTEEEILSALKEAFADGYTSVKLYFMRGLPTETDDDIRGIGVLVEKIRRTYFEIAHNKKLNVSVSCSVFIPKPVTPFQWCAQISMEEMERKQQLLRDTFKGMKGVSLSWHDATTSAVEGIFARGDERLNEVIEEAYLSGAKFDGWSECFNFDVWINALKKKGFTIGDFNKEFKENDELPWDVIDPCVDKSYLWREHEKGMRAERTRNCREGYNLCGIQKTTKCTICGGRK